MTQQRRPPTKSQRPDYYPSVTEAEKFRRYSQPSRLVDNQHLPFPLSASPVELSELGVGISLYFTTVKWLGVTFLFMALGCSYNMLYNFWVGTAADGSYQNLALGNLGYSVPPTWHSGADTAVAVLFLLSVLGCYRHLLKRIPEIDQHNITCADYSILVDSVPPHATDAKMYLDHFRRYGPIAEVSVAMDNVDLIGLQHRRAHLEEQLRRLEGRIARGMNCCTACEGSEVQSTRHQLEDLEAQIVAAKQRKVYRASAVFVSFEHAADRNVCVEDHKRKHIGHIICGCCCAPGPRYLPLDRM